MPTVETTGFFIASFSISPVAYASLHFLKKLSFPLLFQIALIELLAISVIEIYWQCGSLLKLHCSECLAHRAIEECRGGVRQCIACSIISMNQWLPKVPLGVWMLLSDKSLWKQNPSAPSLVGEGNEICISPLWKINVIGSLKKLWQVDLFEIWGGLMLRYHIISNIKPPTLVGKRGKINGIWIVIVILNFGAWITLVHASLPPPSPPHPTACMSSFWMESYWNLTLSHCHPSFLFSL